jgi:hypothetical protein
MVRSLEIVSNKVGPEIVGHTTLAQIRVCQQSTIVLETFQRDGAFGDRDGLAGYFRQIMARQYFPCCHHQLKCEFPGE